MKNELPNTLKNDQEISNWAHHWLRKSAPWIYDFLLPASGKPESDLMEPVWLQAPPGQLGAAVVSFMVSVEGVVLIIPLLNNLRQHGAWLASWPVHQKGEPDTDCRGLWQPVHLRLIIDVERRMMVLQQEWKNPNFISHFLIGTWQENDPRWHMVLQQVQKEGPFKFLIPCSLESYEKLIHTESTTLNENLMLHSLAWNVKFINIHKGNDDTRPLLH